MNSWQNNETLKFELHELVRVCDTSSEYYDQAGHVRATRQVAEGLEPMYIVEFEGENGLPEFNSTDLAKITPSPTENLTQEEPTKFTLTRENYVEVAKWIGPDVRISSPWKNPKLHFETGFAKPGFKTTASIGDTIEKLPDGKFQIWVHESNVAADEPPPSMRADMKKEDRPSEMKKFRTGDPLTQARTMVYQMFYVGKAPLYDIYVVWFSSVLNGWKALVSTNVLDNCYYEVTHDGAKGRTYVDRYVKETNVTVHDNGAADFRQITDFGRIW